ncbi:MAG: hypothetical protein AVDCRST_MAG42-2421 [uncultured Chthoniobacterales bacterium]|uniref:Uncharacterized protein n=1 Tax=uncultured Chthoniobacterales bacterium TaxID=1836801 RepID=A0A6J4ICY1_9BACT|nr:MAG: hypothetical protein AVDCRST_MAG42-2421 [uncultured Chthoniobacterales bacterium]
MLFCDALGVSIHEITADEQQRQRVCVRQRASAGKVVREGDPPRELKHVIEHVLAFAQLCCLDFDARLFAIEAVEHADDQRQPDACEQVT